MKRVLFVNENELGHGSYLLPFVGVFEGDPTLGIAPSVLNATPIPGWLGRLANQSVPLLRRLHLDLHALRWRLGVSRHVREEVWRTAAGGELDAIVVNTQSVGLGLQEIAREIPVILCLDATFRQLARTGWFARDGIARHLTQPLTLGALLQREREAFEGAAHLLAWSGSVRDSLVVEYGIPESRVSLLPPSLRVEDQPGPSGRSSGRAQILFIGGDFRRKGGLVLRECFQRHLRDHCELHIVTQSNISALPGEHIHRGLVPHSPAWRERWRSADVFVLPSELETFGIVLLEALSFGIPVVSSRAGAAEEILGGGEAGLLVERPDADSLAEAIQGVLNNPMAAHARARCGRLRIAQRYDLDSNSARLAGVIHQAVEGQAKRAEPFATVRLAE